MLPLRMKAVPRSLVDASITLPVSRLLGSGVRGVGAPHGRACAESRPRACLGLLTGAGRPPPGCCLCWRLDWQLALQPARHCPRPPPPGVQSRPHPHLADRYLLSSSPPTPLAPSSGGNEAAHSWAQKFELRPFPAIRITQWDTAGYLVSYKQKGSV